MHNSPSKNTLVDKIMLKKNTYNAQKTIDMQINLNTNIDNDDYTPKNGKSGFSGRSKSIFVGGRSGNASGINSSRVVNFN